MKIIQNYFPNVTNNYFYYLKENYHLFNITH